MKIHSIVFGLLNADKRIYSHGEINRNIFVTNTPKITTKTTITVVLKLVGTNAQARMKILGLKYTFSASKQTKLFVFFLYCDKSRNVSDIFLSAHNLL
jgi:hypothetical protein